MNFDPNLYLDGYLPTAVLTYLQLFVLITIYCQIQTSKDYKTEL